MKDLCHADLTPSRQSHPRLVSDDRARVAGVAARLTDLAIAAAFAGGLAADEALDDFVARAALLLGGEADSLEPGGARLVAQVLASDVAEVPRRPCGAVTRTGRDETSRAA